jgi:hypothetical protein
MTVTLSIFGIAFAAFCVWLTVRIINRRERWAKWTLAGVIVGLPVLYVASFGPACWIASHTVRFDSSYDSIPVAYWPIGRMTLMENIVGDCLLRYAQFGMKTDAWISIPTSSDGFRLVIFGDSVTAANDRDSLLAKPEMSD